MKINPMQPGFLPNAIKIPIDIKVGDTVTLKAVEHSFCGTTGKTSYKPAVPGLTVMRVYPCGRYPRITAERGTYGKDLQQYDATFKAFIKE